MQMINVEIRRIDNELVELDKSVQELRPKVWRSDPYTKAISTMFVLLEEIKIMTKKAV